MRAVDVVLFLLLTAVALATLAGLAWLSLRGSQAYVAGRVRVELEERLALAQMERITFLAMQRMFDEVRRSQRTSSQ